MDVIDLAGIYSDRPEHVDPGASDRTLRRQREERGLETLDPRAVSEYEAVLRRLREDRDAVVAYGTGEDIEPLGEKIAIIEAELRQARATRSARGRARDKVQKAIKRAEQKIDEAGLSDLANHLSSTISEGSQPSYGSPGDHPSWWIEID